MTRRELTRDDVTYENGFPANINMGEKIVVQVTEKPEQSVVLYRALGSGRHTRSYFGYEFADKYEPGIYEI